MMSPDPNFLHSTLGLSQIPRWNIFFPCNSTKSQTHHFSSLTHSGRSEIFRVSGPETRSQVGFPFAKRVGSSTSILPSGSWWALPELREDGAEPTAAMLALRRMWELVADERLVAFVAAGSLVIAAVSVNCNSY